MKNIYTKIAILFFLISILTTPLLFTPTKVNAVGTGSVGCGASSAVSGGVGAAASAINVPTFDGANFSMNSMLTAKECMLDGILTLAREMLIKTITQSIVKWINSGFKGSPAFVTDLGGEMEKIADSIIGDFISKSNLDFLCNPLDISLGLTTTFQGTGSSFEDKYKCTLSDVMDNAETFIQDNDFSEGGISGFLELSTNVNNNPYSQLIGAQVELAGRISAAQEEKKEVLAWGEGFLSKEECDIEAGTGKKSNCQIITPGQVINTQLNDTLGTGLAQLELADEIDEIIAALLGQLAQKAMGGLSSLTSTDSSGKSYFDKIGDEQQPSSGTSQQIIYQQVLAQKNAIIKNEESYKKNKTSSFFLINDTKADWQLVYNCYDSSTTQIAIAKVNNASAKINSLQTKSDTLLTEIIKSEKDIKNLTDFFDKNINKIKNLTTLSEIQNFLNTEGVDLNKYDQESANKVQSSDYELVQVQYDTTDSQNEAKKELSQCEQNFNQSNNNQPTIDKKNVIITNKTTYKNKKISSHSLTDEAKTEWEKVYNCYNPLYPQKASSVQTTINGLTDKLNVFSGEITQLNSDLTQINNPLSQGSYDLDSLYETTKTDVQNAETELSDTKIEMGISKVNAQNGLQECNDLKSGSSLDNTPDSFIFNNLSNVSSNSSITSNEIVKISGINDGVGISIGGDGSPTYRICDDDTCSNIIEDWTETDKTIDNEQYIQLQAMSHLGVGTTNEIIITVGTYSTKWEITTSVSIPSITTVTCVNSITYQNQNYSIVGIGPQCWFAENLNVGTMLNSASSIPDTNDGDIKKWCYNDDTNNCDSLGGLYSWEEANQDGYPNSNGTDICPNGWHIPSNAEYEILEAYVGLVSKDTSSFQAKLAGYRHVSPFYTGKDAFLQMWTSTEDSTDSSKAWRRYFSAIGTTSSTYDYVKSTFDKQYGFSVRCVEDVDNQPSSFNFSKINDVELNFVTNSKIVKISDIDDNIIVSISGDGFPKYRICDDGNCSISNIDHNWSDSVGLIDDNQYLQLQLTSASNANETNTATITVGTEIVNWEVTSTNTSPGSPTDNTPDSFSFNDYNNEPTDTSVTSNIVEISGIDDGVGISIGGDSSSEYRICSDGACSTIIKSWTKTDETIDNGQYIQLQLTSASNANETNTATITVGTVSVDWNVTSGSSITTVTCDDSITYQGQIYPIVGIGTQCWFAKNLDVGTMLNSVSSNPNTNDFSLEKWCYDDLDTNCDTYGGLYSWEEANKDGYPDSNGTDICPDDWHIPSKIESQITYPDSFQTILPGYRHASSFYTGEDSYFRMWTSTEESTDEAWHIFFPASNQVLFDKQHGLSVRCVEDVDNQPSSFNFPNINDAELNLDTKSEIVEISGIDYNIIVDISGDGLPKYRICGDDTCSTSNIIEDWTDVAKTIDNGQYIQLQLTSDSNANETNTATITVGTVSVDWEVSTTDCAGTVNYSGQDYPVVKAGTQCWFAKNLDVGTMINSNVDMSDNTTIEKYCYDNSDTNCVTYGGLYQWEEAMAYTSSAQGICPSGWHIPSDAEFKTLEEYIGIAQADLNKTGERDITQTPQGPADLDILFGGHWDDYVDNFSEEGVSTDLWTSTEYGSTSNVWKRYLIETSQDSVTRTPSIKSHGYSLRCIKD